MRWQRSTIFYFEQWVALFIGIACMAVCSWALLDGHQAFSSSHHPASAEHVIPTLGWLLTIAVAVIGIHLTRFAFYTPPNERGQEDASRDVLRGKNHAGGRSRVTKLVAANKGRS